MISALILATFLSPPLHATTTDYTTPTKLLKPSEYPIFTDDLELQGLADAAKLQLEFYKTADLSGTITMGGKAYPLTRARDSLKVFLRIADDFKYCRKYSAAAECFKYFNRDVRSRFHVFAADVQPGDPRYGQAETALFTGYATQLVSGTMTPDATSLSPRRASSPSG